ncbi:glucose 1-dehydrogenase [Noviherbaspirillum sedimenti]|uniref:Glucose 1-dehydrogenase n=2 Tax=Noviherbaspirillum sedimenti TaxID=2320865 RepID=A0A3A3G6X5_9BURK|nr:glucose 1-dehydrogenase [Noviherbaspirillum sedimenti]
MKGLFEGKVVIVTGAGGAIGRAAAIKFAAEGARVTVSDLSEESVAETVRIIKEAGGDALPIVGDISLDEHVQRMVNVTVERFGGVDCAFNNAGITHAEDYKWDEAVFRRTLEINLISQMLCMKYQIPQMLRRGKGAIVNTSSIQGLVGVVEPPLPAYTASKHAVIGLSKSTALEYARSNIRVNALCPGVTRSAMVDKVMVMSESIRQRLLNHAPLGRLAEPEEVAEAALWLCSDKASFVTGHAMVVDGGFTAQ